MSYKQEYERWLHSDALSPAEHAELERIAGDEKEIENRFYGPLEFGTAGLRGTMKVGLHQMNIHVIRWATQGFANVIAAEGEEAKKKGVAICMDCRNNNMLFSHAAAEVCAANGIHVRIFESLRPTPELSFAVRYYGCQAGINVTASHNPKEYNGYKVYWSDGAQLPPQHADAIAAQLEKIDIFTGIKRMDFDEAVQKGLITMLGVDCDERFMANVMSMVNDYDTVRKVSGDFKLVYTPFHGCGYKLVPEALTKLGIKHLLCVPEQMVIDGDFPTVESPNPEERKTMSMAIDLAAKEGADLVLATDPDSDRIGVALRNKKGEYVLLNGNQTLVLLMSYQLTRWAERGELDGNQYVVKTIVTSQMANAVADHFKVKCYDCLTGFKYIARIIRNNEGKATYIGGGEESFGYLAGDYVRDKDAVSACSLAAEAAAWAMDTMGLTLYEWLQELYVKYGFYREGLVSVVRKGKEGAELIQKMMVDFRANPPKTLAGSPVTAIKDYLDLNATDLINGNVSKLDFPTTSNVLQFFNALGDKVSIRPSGTEPKIKFYVEVREPLKDAADYEATVEKADKHIDAILKDLKIQ